MKRLIADMHMHTIASGHAYGTIREMAAAAFEAGLNTIGISEHAPGIPGTVETIYFSNLKVVPRFISGVEILHGSEVNVLNGGKLSLSERSLNHLDYGIVGIHSLCYTNDGIEGNTDNLIECMKHPKINFVSHPDDSRMPLNYERLVKAAKEYHVALEVNNSSLVANTSRENVRENYTTMIKLCKELNVPIIVNTDAHDPSQVGKFELAYEFLEQFDIDDLVLNNDIQKLKEFIKK